MKGMNRRQRRDVRFGSNARRGGMSRRQFLGTAAAGVGAAMAGRGGIVKAAEATTNIIHVPEDVPDPLPAPYEPDQLIQWAVDAANPGDTIKVGPGEYKGALIGANVVEWGFVEPYPFPVPTKYALVDKSNLKIIGSGEETKIKWADFIILTLISWDGVTEISELLPLGFGIAADGVEISDFSFDNLTLTIPFPPPPLPPSYSSGNSHIRHCRQWNVEPSDNER